MSRPIKTLGAVVALAASLAFATALRAQEPSGTGDHGAGHGQNTGGGTMPMAQMMARMDRMMTRMNRMMENCEMMMGARKDGAGPGHGQHAPMPGKKG